MRSQPIYPITHFGNSRVFFVALKVQCSSGRWVVLGHQLRLVSFIPLFTFIYSGCLTWQAVVSDFWTTNSSAVVSYVILCAVLYKLKIHCAIEIPQNRPVKPHNFSPNRDFHGPVFTSQRAQDKLPNPTCEGCWLCHAKLLKRCTFCTVIR